ncbi:MAG: tetratricopeptide repeat protein [Isosphaeraceae bacterium]
MALIQDNLEQDHAAEASYRRAVEVLSPLCASHPNRNEFRETLADALSSQCQFYDLRGRTGEAEAAGLRCLKIREELAAGESSRQAQRDLGLACFRLALLYHRDSRFAAAEPLYNRALAVQEGLARDEPGDDHCQHDLSQTLYELGYLYSLDGRIEKAVDLYEWQVRILRSLAAKRSDSSLYKHSLSASLNYLGTLYRRISRFGDAERIGLEAVQLHETLVRDHPDIPNNRDTLAVGYVNLANLYFELDRLEEAERMYRKAMAICDALMRSNPGIVRYRARLASSYTHLGRVRGLLGHPQEALDWLVRASEALGPAITMQKQNAASSEGLRWIRVRKAEVLTALRRFPEALTEWNRAIEGAANRADKNEMAASRSVTLARSGDLALALLEARRILDDQNSDGEALYNAARVEGLAAAASRNDSALSPVERRERVRLHTSRAQVALERAVAAGYPDTPRNFRLLKEEHDLDPLRGTPEFRLLMWDIAMPADPFEY